MTPALIDGFRLSSLDRAWSLFVEHGVTRVPRADEAAPVPRCRYTDGELGGVPAAESIFLDATALRRPT
jgi:hypothetical protein